VVNQIVFQPKNSCCETCTARVKIQQKYLNQIFDLYQDFHVVQLPLLGTEVRGDRRIIF
jgi:arsenite/tail-anchored protein-transporting ATPase